MKHRLFLLISLMLISIFVSAQPATDIIIFDINYSDGVLSVENPNWVTQRDGYDNQPHFDPEGEYLYYTSIDEAGQADIYRYHLSSKENERFTFTDSTSEYSPTVMPNRKHISVIMVEADGKTQRLWKFPIKGGKPRIIMDKIQPVGYHSWMNKKELVMFILDDPPTLQHTHVKKQVPTVLEKNIGRSIHRFPDKDKMIVNFVMKESEDNWNIYRYDLENKSNMKVINCLAGSEDFCWGGEDYLLMGQGSSLFMMHQWNNGGWKLIDDLRLGSISRLAMNQAGTKLAVVVTRK